MGSWAHFSILWILTGSPVTAAAILVVGYAVADWYTFGFLRGVARAVADFGRGQRLRMLLLQNPHDRKARADLGEILLSQRRYRRAIEVVKPIADQDPHDLAALYMLGVACFGTGRIVQGDLFLSQVSAADPAFKDGLPALQLGRWRLRDRDAGALWPLREYVKTHPHSVEGRYLLSIAFQLAGDPAAATAERERCWTEYESELPYQRRRDRLWAWRARPSRPVLYAAVVAGALVLFGSAVQRSAPREHAAADVRTSSIAR